ncbi:MAG: tRNA (adenosine(37)-N6)-threonylcarbamoyltransferase complex ATPase subunit type 1 TsaE [Thermodesulfobacteriota bacterium]|nr:tRNA (adenosine(37)-N6)-threonylcarbamoyltransferase complex ATPase subunit type 1 TsaE [Thermodesulfobacteriota bacterium]
MRRAGVELKLFLAGPEDTLRLGRLLGERLAKGAVVALTGELGAGKTCLTQGLAQGLGVPENQPVVSPSFTLANEYFGRAPLFHLDLYRLEGDDFFEAGLDEYFLRDGITVVEWAEKIEPDLPRPRLEIRLIIEASGGRMAVLGSRGPDFEKMIRELGAGWPKTAVRGKQWL